MNIHKKYQAAGLAIIAAVITVFNPGIAVTGLDTNVPNDISGEETVAIVVEDFEKAIISGSFDADGWYVQTTPKQFGKEADAEKKAKMKNPVPILDFKIIDGSPNDMAPEKWSLTDLGKEKQKCLGIRFQFRYPGYNSVHVLPPNEVYWKDRKKAVLTYNPSTRKDEAERAIQLPGKSKAISMWVHSRGKPYSLEVWVKDYKGNTHVLPMGSLKFVGWRPLKAYMPTAVPQETDTYPQTRTTKITKFVIRSNHMAPKDTLIEDTYIFFDQIKVLTDTYEVNFDGSELHKTFEKGNEESKK